MRRILNILLIIFTAVSYTFAQVDFATKAMLKLQEGDLATAKQMIDQASADAKYSLEAKTWHYKAFIYKDLYKTSKDLNESISNRANALEYATKCTALDTKSEFKADNDKLITYITNTYFNDAKLTAKDSKFELSEQFLSKYKSARKILVTTNDIDINEINYYLYVGSLYNSIALSDTTYKREYSEKAKNTYIKVIEIDANNINANYNLAILYYNQAVDMIKALDFETDLIMLSQIQDESVLIFKKSLPYMERAHQLDPKNISTLKGLEGIYFSLNEKEKTEEIRKKIAELENK